MAKNIYRSGVLANGSEYTVAGYAHNGDAQEISDEITKIGQDAAIILPQYNVAGVFDGAGGATDVGSPEIAALSACEAVKEYFTRGGKRTDSAMEFARAKVKMNPEAGVCVGALVRLAKYVDGVNAGDTTIFSYDTQKKEMDILAKQQKESNFGGGNPSNYLGRRIPGVKQPISDFLFERDMFADTEELHIMSDGAFGDHIHETTPDYLLAAAHDDYGLLRDALAEDPNLEQTIRHILRGDRARRLARAQLADTETPYKSGKVYSPELEKPNLFSVKSFDWAIWEEIVKPYVETLNIQRRDIDTRFVCEALLQRPIAWDFERPRIDDATIVMIRQS